MDATEKARLRTVFKRRRAARKGICFAALALMVGVTLLAFPSWELLGLPKLVWAPFFYLVMFGLIIAIAVVWRCPLCNGLLGDVFTTRFCSKCGICLDDGETVSDPEDDLSRDGSTPDPGDKTSRVC